MFLHMSVILFTGGVVSHHELQVASQHGLQQVSMGMVSKHALQVSRPKPRGEVEGSGWRISKPIPKGEVVWPGGSPGPHPGWGCVSQHALRQTRPPLPPTATANFVSAVSLKINETNKLCILKM